MLELPQPPARYDAEYERRRNEALETADRENRKTQRDVDVIYPERLRLQSPDGSLFYLTVDNGGVLTAEPVP